MLESVLERGILRVPVVWWEPPSEGPPPEWFRDPDSGEPQGVVPELAKIMAEDLGVRLELIEVEWPQMMEAVLGDEVDLLMSYTNLPERALRLDFCGPLLPDDVKALVRKAEDRSSLGELDRSGVTVGVATASSVIEIARLHFRHASIIELDDPVAGVVSGVVDVAVEAAITRPLLERQPTLRTVKGDAGRSLVLGQEFGHPAVRQGDPRAVRWIRNWLEYHKAQGTIGYWCGTYWKSWMAD